MPTILQIEANRRNAQNSTGPRTDQGKAVSRFNALKTGIDARSHVIPGEDPNVLETGRAAWKWGQDFILPPGFCPASCGGSENAGQKAGGRMKS
jgi:hypothetical protein